jgi:WhiB family transcriptional regulator, redox-sensing transcriptional regulator
MLSSDAAAGISRWMSRGACRGEDPDLFFPIGAQGTALDQVSAAKAVCRGCAVNADCLSFGLETGQEGIWGGTTGEERHAMRRRPAGRARFRSQ